ncbi:MAG TPA: hypothetical protein VKE40_02165 [Gemmataceae bacterium]|nr:hypothetical protein [Gemmataceae bacterium]
MIIRNCLPGDTDHEAAVYNVAAAQLPGFRRLTIDDVRRTSGGRFFAEDNGRVVGFAAFEPHGRVHYPWCLPGHELAAHQLFGQVMRTLAERKVPRAHAVCRADWPLQVQFFEAQGFAHVREMVNFSQSIGDLPTMFQRPSLNVTLVRPGDLPAIESMVSGLPRLRGPALANYLMTSGLATEAVFVLRRSDGSPRGVGVLIDDAALPGVETLDAKSPAFWFGAFGTEGLPAKRVNGLFSFVAPPGKDLLHVGQDLLWYATSRLETTSFNSLAAQVPSDASHLLHFYESYFRKQGSFPVFERDVGTASRN